MSKINRTVALLLSAVFMFNSVNYDVVVKAITENVQEYMEEKKAEEQQKEDDETKEVTTSAETTEVTETVETTETSAETTVTETSKESDDIVTTTKPVDVHDGDIEIDSDTVFSTDKTINGNLTIKSNGKLFLKYGVTLEVNGDFIIEPDAEFTVSENDVKVNVNGNLIIDGKFHFSESHITVSGNIIERETGAEIQGNGTVLLNGKNQQTIDVHSRINNLVNENTSDKSLYFTNSLNFGRYVDNGKGIITYAKDESGNITDKAGTVTVKNDIKFFCSESQSDNKELVIHGNLCVDKGYVEIIDVSSNNSNKVLLKIEGDFIQQDGEFVTKGQKMEVDGNYNLNGGKYQIMDNGSVLNVGKNLTIQNKSEFIMEHSGTEINVDGNFTVKNTNQNRFKDGIINIKGDFIQEGPGDNFKTYGEADKNCNHLVHMVGDKKQKISFENPTTLNADKSVNERQAQFATLKLEHYYDEYDFGDFNPETQRIYENLEPPVNEFQKNNGEPYRIRRSMKTPLSHLELVTSGGYIYAIGGVDRENEVSGDICRYDFEDNIWVQTNELNTRRMDFASAVNDKTIYVLGGYDGTEIVNNVEVISEETGVKTIETENVLIKRKSHEAVYYNGKIYIMGGEDADGNILNTVEVYDPVTNTSETIASMGTERKNFGATLYIDGTKAYLAVAGGENSRGLLDSVEFFELTAQDAKWETKAELTVPRKGLGLEFLMGKLFAVGGKSENGYLKTVECFTGKSWNKLTNDIDEDITTSKERAFFGSAVAYNSIFIAGGENPSVLRNCHKIN